MRPELSLKLEHYSNKSRKRMCCRCGLRLAMRQNRSSYCLACHAASMRAWRQNHPYCERDAVARFKSTMRAYANVYAKRGKLLRAPCCFCGRSDAEKHHPDYSQPLLVIWLCRTCHLDIHSAGEEQSGDYVERLAFQWDKKRKLRVKQLRQLAKDHRNATLIAASLRKAQAHAKQRQKEIRTSDIGCTLPLELS